MMSISCAVGPGTGVSHTQRRHLADFGARRIRRVLVEAQRAGRDDARPVDLARFDLVAQRDVAFGGTAGGEKRRVARFELGLHLRLLHRTGVEVPVRVDEPWHGRHALGVDRLPGGRGRTGRACRDDLSSAHHDGAALDHAGIGPDNADVGDRQVLRHCRRSGATGQNHQRNREGVHRRVSHRLRLSRRIPVFRRTA
jgi:hypothetical protein